MEQPCVLPGSATRGAPRHASLCTVDLPPPPFFELGDRTQSAARWPRAVHLRAALRILWLVSRTIGFADFLSHRATVESQATIGSLRTGYSGMLPGVRTGGGGESESGWETRAQLHSGTVRAAVLAVCVCLSCARDRQSRCCFSC